MRASDCKRLLVLLLMLAAVGCGGEGKTVTTMTPAAAPALKVPQAAADAGSEDPREAADTPQDSPPAAAAPEGPFAKGNFELEYHTGGGFAGQGCGQLVIDRQGMATSRLMTATCKKKVDKAAYAEIVDLLNLHEALSWEENYDPTNPLCCCDQFIYMFSFKIDGEEPAASRWCSASMKNVPGGNEVVDKIQEIIDSTNESGLCE